jgi:hypothetical protein
MQIGPCENAWNLPRPSIATGLPRWGTQAGIPLKPNRGNSFWYQDLGYQSENIAKQDIL